ncbi:glycosyltransferase [Tatumella citrea]|uniref:Rhamnosyltransferase n=1 Tax=Tatumella citrea TaxID=53336 RepID=A0A1Y0L5Y2_TATCI|nr:glycosyltransferase [Tatumella citrea]ARU93079.1 rhamnosyltransferase [Tatumella citrea]ARU97117.1 rhamnosyltransferase [Tatumella citrea]
MNYFVAIPVYNGGTVWQQCVDNLKKYAPDNLHVQVIDSSSKDNSVEIARQAGFDVLTISSAEFNHGGTRNQALQMQSGHYDVVIFLTQDAIPQPGFIENIISVFSDPQVACAYGRQLPHDDANPLAQHARLFNYPPVSHIYSQHDIPQKGIKVAFMSNSFSAYRTDVYKEIGGFPLETILCEDMYFTAKAVLAGYKVAYAAQAQVKHSHNYTPAEEFRRYFDIGVFHTDEPWIRQQFGGAGGEGKKFILSEFRYLIKHGLWYIPVACLNNFMKIVGYKLGQKYKKIPAGVIKKLSMHKRYWTNK